MKKKLTVFIILMALFLLGCPGDNVPDTYSITINSSGNESEESVLANVSTALAGETITLTTRISSDRKVSLSTSGIDIAPGIVSNDGGSATFIMPTGDVTITAEFSNITTNTVLYSGYAISSGKMANANVSIETLSGTIIANGTTDAEGHYDITVLEEGVNREPSSNLRAIITNVNVPSRVKVIDPTTNVEESMIIPADTPLSGLPVVSPFTTGLDNACKEEQDPEAAWETAVAALPEEVGNLFEPMENEGIYDSLIEIVIETGAEAIKAELSDDGSFNSSSATPIAEQTITETIVTKHQGQLSGTWTNSDYNGRGGQPPGKIVHKTSDINGMTMDTYENDYDSSPLAEASYSYQGLDPKGYIKYHLVHLGDHYNFIFRSGTDAQSRNFQEYQGRYTDDISDLVYPTEFLLSGPAAIFYK